MEESLDQKKSTERTSLPNPIPICRPRKKLLSGLINIAPPGHVEEWQNRTLFSNDFYVKTDPMDQNQLGWAEDEHV